MKKVSLDFDATLSRTDVQRFAKEIMHLAEVWIVTSRMSNEYAKENMGSETYIRVDKQNRKLFRIADNIGIKREHIVFTNHTDKIIFLEGKNFTFHLDDDPDELMEILNSKDTCKPINVEHMDWEQDCKNLL